MKTLTRIFLPFSRPRRAAALAAFAGRADSSRRGTVLVLILGALAIISIVTLLYYTVGRSDTRTASVTRDRSRIDGTVFNIADYLNGVVSDSTVAVFCDGTDIAAAATGNQILIRKTWDYPYTDPFRRSILGAGVSNYQRFRATGSYDDSVPLQTDPRRPYQPWLSSATPTQLLGGTNTPRPYDLARDWEHISNFAPDGGFVNLYNLAPLLNGQRVSRFGVASVRAGSNGTPQGPASANPEARWGLTLFDRNGQVSAPAGSPQSLPNGAQADPNTPAHWTMWQQQAVRLASADPRYGPGSPEYVKYQWCDTDGDGVMDARWFEMVDAFLPNDIRSLLPQDDRHRWFIAAKAVDLSAAINVNTGLDQRLPPGQTGAALAQTSKLGIFPDVDLFRLLRSDDNYFMFGFGYDKLQNDGTEGLFGTNNYDWDFSRRVGETAYNAIRFSLRRENAAVPDRSVDFRTAANPPLTADERADDYLRNGGHINGSFSPAGSPTISLRSPFGMADLQELLTRARTNDPTVTSRLEQVAEGRNNVAAGGSLVTERVGVLRSTRSDEAERGTADDQGNIADGWLDQDARARLTFDPRQYLTTLSGGRSFQSFAIGSQPVGRITINELPIDVRTAATQIGSSTPSARNPELMFQGYAGALMPYSWRTEFWGAAYNRFRTLTYANNPELAIRIAGHLAANFGDCWDRDKDFSGYTLLLNRDARGTVNGSAGHYPWWTTNAGKLDLTDQVLPSGAAGTTLTSSAVNLYGIEAQPFITQAVSIVLYTDAPSPGGDVENDGTVLPGSEPEITINGTRGFGPASRVSDFIGEIIAFQLTNPFDVAIPLSDPTHRQNYETLADTTYSAFYLEFNGIFFKLAADGVAGLQGVILRPGETRTFFALSNSLGEMQTRVDRAADTASGNVNPLPEVVSFIENQLSVTAFPAQYAYSNDLVANGTRVRPIMLRRMDPTTGISSPVYGDILGGANPTAKRNVFLWHAPANAASFAGDRSRHILADRLFDPGTQNSSRSGPTLDRLMPESNQDISGTRAGPQPPDINRPDPNVSYDNTGFTIALWGSVKRADNPVDTPIGAIPAYCLEPRWASTQLRNICETDGANPANLSRSDFDNQRNAAFTVREFFQNTMTTASAPGGNPAANPGAYPGVFILANGTHGTITAAAHQKRYTPHIIGNNFDGHSFDYDAGGGPTPPGARRNLYPRIAINNRAFEERLGVNGPAQTISTMRLADLLLPLGIGPEYDPDPGIAPPAPNSGQGIQVNRCMTLAEALAVALNYSNPPQAGDPFSIYYRIGTTAVPTAAEPSNGALDRGQLSLRRFTAFEDANGNCTYDAGDTVRWPGIPLGLNILNTFRTLDSEFWNLTRSTPGQININTAATPVLRCLPLLSPTTDTSTLPAQPGQAWSAYLTLAGTNIATPELPNVDADMAAAVAAYRSKGRVFRRNTATGGIEAVDFQDTTPDPFAIGTGDGRFTTTQINGIRETPGIASLGEVLSITTTSAAPANRMPLIDRLDGLGDDGRRSGTIGTMSVPALSRTLNPAPTKDEVVDDFQESLLVAQGLLNSVNVRSDVFAIWFVVHGYQKSDTENLGPADPLLPSVAKRYLLVLDRSNVTRAGEKAKVLLFKELPM